MENWQLTLVILSAVFVGAMIPMLIMGAVAVYRAGRAVAELSGQAAGLLTKVESVSDRVEVLTRGLDGDEANVADLVAAVGRIVRGLERNMKLVDIVSTTLAAIGAAVAAYLNARSAAAQAGPVDPGDATTPVADRPPPAPAADSPEANLDAH